MGTGPVIIAYTYFTDIRRNIPQQFKHLPGIFSYFQTVGMANALVVPDASQTRSLLPGQDDADGGQKGNAGLTPRQNPPIVWNEHRAKAGPVRGGTQRSAPTRTVDPICFVEVRHAV